MKYLFTGLSTAQSIIMALLILTFIAVLAYIAYRIMRYGWETAAELFDEYLDGKIKDAVSREEWREMNQIIRDSELNGEWAQYEQ